MADYYVYDTIRGQVNALRRLPPEVTQHDTHHLRVAARRMPKSSGYQLL